MKHWWHRHRYGIEVEWHERIVTGHTVVSVTGRCRCGDTKQVCVIDVPKASVERCIGIDRCGVEWAKGTA